MKKTIYSISVVLLLFVGFGKQTVVAVTKDDRYIGLHDRLLAFGQDEIVLIEGEKFVPFVKLIEYLYADIMYADKIYTTKNNHEVTYDYGTGKTFADGNESEGDPIRTLNDKLYVKVTFIAKSYGFHHEYFSELGITRIFSDSYKSMNSTDYAIYMKALFDKKNKPELAPTPTPPVLAPVIPKKANVYLTFDDGPNKFTTTNAATLKNYNVQGTFFFLGNLMNSNPTIVKSIANEGHYIGSHSMTHDKSKVYQSDTAFIDEMSEGVSIIQKLTGQDAKLVRVPYGSSPHVTAAMKSQLNKYGYKMWDWTVDSNDWRYTEKEFGEIVKNVQAGVNKSYNSGNREIIVLLHDRAQTASALPQIIEWLQKEGYSIKKYEPTNHIVHNFLRDVSL